MAETNSGAAAAIESLDPRIRYTLHDGVATITIAQPEKRNAVAPPMWDALTAHFTRCSSDPEVRAVIFIGEGGHFCSGSDLDAIDQIGRASGRERVCKYMSIWGVAETLKKKKQQ